MENEIKMLKMLAGEVVEPASSWGLWEGDIVTYLDELPSKDAKVKWTGSPMPLYMFREILGFFKWSFDEYGCESQIRLYYNTEHDLWKWVAMPQWITAGLSSYENDNHDEFSKIQERMVLLGYSHVGSGHHHCKAGAFQSGTDFADEIKTSGFHFTIGKLDETQFGFHCRSVVRKVCYDWSGLEVLPFDNTSLLAEGLVEPTEENKMRMAKKPLPPVRKLKPLVNGTHGLGKGYTGNAGNAGGAGEYGQQDEWDYGSYYNGDSSYYNIDRDYNVKKDDADGNADHSDYEVNQYPDAYDMLQQMIGYDALAIGDQYTLDTIVDILDREMFFDETTDVTPQIMDVFVDLCKQMRLEYKGV